MKKTIAILLVAIMATLLLASCMSKSGYDWEETSAVGYGSGSTEAPRDALSSSANNAMRSEVEYDYYDSVYTSAQLASQYTGSSIVPITTEDANDSMAEKIIYTVNADIETIDFEETIDMVYEMLANNGGFIENSNIGGKNYAQTYRGWQTYRNAMFILRIPKERLNAVTASLGALGNVTSLRSDADNITAKFYDTESRLSSYKIQEERLLSMLAKSETVADMITIEERLAEVRYQIETLTSSLRNWQDQVDYSYLNLQIVEVEVMTEITPIKQLTYWQQIGEGLKDTALGVADFFKELFKWLVINLPVIVILVVIAVVVIIIVKWRIRLSAKRAKDKPQKPQRPQVPQYPQYPFNPYGPQYAQPPQGSPGSPGSPELQEAPAPQGSSAPQEESEDDGESRDGDSSDEVK